MYSPMKLNLDFVRRQFPAFQEPVLLDQSHFENAGGSYVCQQVIDRLSRFYHQRKVQPYGAFALSRLGGEEMDEARSRLAEFLGVLPTELSFGPSTSQNVYVLANAMAHNLTDRDTIIVTNQDHEANTGPWRRLEKIGVRIREWTIDSDSGLLDLEMLANMLDTNVRLVCFPHCSNIVGAINPVREIADMVHSAGGIICVDGVSYAPHGLPDLSELDTDIYLFSTYKTYGPHQGIMVLRNDVDKKFENQSHNFHKNNPVLRMTPAGPDHAQIAACAGIIDYMESLLDAHNHDGLNVRPSRYLKQLLTSHECTLMTHLIDYLTEQKTVRLLGPIDPHLRVPTISLCHKKPGAELAKQLSCHGLMAGGGDFYARRCLEGMGIDAEHGVLRLSFVHYTSMQDIQRLVKGLEKVLN